MGSRASGQRYVLCGCLEDQNCWRRRPGVGPTVDQDLVGADQLVDRAVDDRADDSAFDLLAKTSLPIDLDWDAILPQNFDSL